MSQDITKKLFEKYPEQFSKYLRGRTIETPPGWDTVIENYVGTLVSLFPKIRFTQIKEKFGVLRSYYTHDYSQNVGKAIDGITSTYEIITESMCDTCGTFENVSPDSGHWMRYTCNEHSRKNSPKSPEAK
jgi:hypothetical protein